MKSVDALLSGLVDYAGLFPPASEDMRPALKNYASYIQSPDRPALGRFIVPISRLKELEESASGIMPQQPGSEPWRLSVLVAGDVRSAGEEMLKYNDRHSSGSTDGHAVIDVVELKASTVDEIGRQRKDLPPSFTAYFEIPVTAEVPALVKTISRVGARAKVRTGGVTPEGFPRASALAHFIAGCKREAVPFKATAGLHHALRGRYALTYEPASQTGMMYGFLNVFMAAALLYAGESEDTALKALEETDPSTFRFEDDAIQWRENGISAQQIRAFRSKFAISFGSCSFREPVEELRYLTRKARSTDQ
ncbi:MAG: hypothetical protein NVSMB53_05400 [Gemmatimonadaceae bacterium]